MKLPKSAEVKTHAAMVRFLVKAVRNANNLETRIEQLEAGARKKPKKKQSDVAPPAKKPNKKGDPNEK